MESNFCLFSEISPKLMSVKTMYNVELKKENKSDNPKLSLRCTTIDNIQNNCDIFNIITEIKKKEEQDLKDIIIHSEICCDLNYVGTLVINCF